METINCSDNNNTSISDYFGNLIINEKKNKILNIKDIIIEIIHSNLEKNDCLDIQNSILNYIFSDKNKSEIPKIDVLESQLSKKNHDSIENCEGYKNLNNYNFNVKKIDNITSNSIFVIDLIEENLEEIERNKIRNKSLIMKLYPYSNLLPSDIYFNILKILSNEDLIPYVIYSNVVGDKENLSNIIIIESNLEYEGYCCGKQTLNEEYISNLIKHIVKYNSIHLESIKELSVEIKSIHMDYLMHYLDNSNLEKLKNNLSKKAFKFYNDECFDNELEKKNDKIDFEEFKKTLLMDKNNEKLNCNFESTLFRNISIFIEEMKEFSLNKFMSGMNIFTYICLSHVDVHNQNMFEKDLKFKFIDYEDISYAPLGFDLAHYLIDISYNIESKYPYFSMTKNDIIEKSKKKFTAIFDKYCNSLNSILNENKGKMENINNIKFSTTYIYALFILCLKKLIIEFITLHDEENSDYTLLLDWLLRRHEFCKIKIDLYLND